MGNYCSTATESAQEKEICTKKNASSAMKRKKRNLKTKETTHAKSNVKLKKLNEDIEKGKGRQFQGEERRLKCESPQVIFQNDSDEEVQVDDVVDAIDYDRSEKEKMDARMRRLETQLEEVRDENRQLLNSLHKHHKLEQLERKVQNLEETIATLKLEKQSLLDRLSENASMKLKDGNPNITDLGDHNRPEKLAEQFSELYDNQWTDGFDLLTTNLKMKDKDAILSLLNIVQMHHKDAIRVLLQLIYETCLSKAESLEQQMHTTLALYLGQAYVSKEDADYRAFREKVMYTIRDFRGQNYYMSMNDVRKDITERLRENMDEKIRKLCKEFISECSRVCWLMCIKNPPMHITSESDILFNKDIYRSYTAKTPYIAYVVWPVLYLHKHGLLLKKGVAQGKRKKPKSAKSRR